MFNYNNLYTCGDQFLIECYYSPYKEFRPFLERDPSKDYSHESSAFGARQYPMWNNVEASRQIKHRNYSTEDILTTPEWDAALKKLTTWTAKKLKQIDQMYCSAKIIRRFQNEKIKIADNILEKIILIFDSNIRNNNK